MKRNLLLISATLLLCVSAFAQRTSRGTAFASIHGGTTFYSWSAEVEAGMYTLSGYWFGAANMSEIALESQNGTRYSMNPVYAVGGYMARIVSNTRRSLCLYGGGGVLLGCELMDPFHRLPKGEPAAIGNRFMYGLRPQVTGEWFFSDSIAMTLDLQLPISICSPVRVCTSNALIGLRYNF